MNTHADKTLKNKSQSVANAISQKSNDVGSTFQFVDNRPEAVAQRKLQEMANSSPQAKQAAQLQAMLDNYSVYKRQPNQKEENSAGNIIQRTINHVHNYGCEEGEVVGENFETHTPSRVEDPIDFSAIRGAIPNSIVHITDKQLAEEVAAELYTWPEEWEPYDRIWITSRGTYKIDEYYDGELVDSYEKRFRFRCQLQERGDGSRYYEVYHFGGPV